MADEKKCPHCGKPVPPTSLGGICPECMLKAGLATQTEGPGATGPHGTKVMPPLPRPEEIAPLFPQLEILECLGRGGMGIVYKARQPHLNRLVALKILAREKEQDVQFAERFTREAQALARLNHPNIVTVYDFGTVGQASRLSPSEKQTENSETGVTPVLHYLLMEFVDGLNLRQLLQAGKMKPEQALAIVPKICEALQYAHEQGIVHRDIKPENILLDKQGRVKIADFGIAKMLGAETEQQNLTGAKDTVGTPHYMAPEQIEKPQTVDHRADIYSLGVVFYEMLTGELPLGKFQPPSKKVQIDVRLDEVVLHALEKEPERRYQQASEVKTDVETIASGGETPPVGTTMGKSGMVRIIEIFFGSTFRSPLAIKLINASALGFLGSLGFLGYLPFPSSYRCFGLFGFTGFFGLIGLAFIVEGFVRQRDLSTAQRRFALVGRRGGKAVIHWPGVLLCLIIALGVGETFTIFVSSILINRIAALPLFTVFCGVLAAVTAMVIGKKLATPLEKLMPLEQPSNQKPDRFWRRFAMTVLALIILVPASFYILAILLPIGAHFAFDRHTQEQEQPVNESIRSDYIGQTWFPQGDSIEITSVKRTKNQMTVKGQYDLVSHDRALLALYCTSTNRTNVPEDPTQRMQISKGRGDFVLARFHLFPGLHHVSMYADGHSFAAVYFGTKAEAQAERKASWITNSSPVFVGAIAAADQIVVKQPPVVVETYPVSGANNVAPGITEIRVRFDKPMTDGSWSWSTAWQDSTPESLGPPHYLADHRTCVMKVRLEPGRTYGWWLNSEKFKNFKDRSDIPAVPYLLTFRTAPASTLSGKADSKKFDANRPRVVSVSPANGATDVEANQEIHIRFDRPINPDEVSLDWESGYFLSNGWPRYVSSRNEMVFPVRLLPGQTNELVIQARSAGTNGLHGGNFTLSRKYRWHFTTRPVKVKPGATRPKVVRVRPKPGKTWAALTFVKITFDQPMLPPDLSPPYLRRKPWSFGLPMLVPSYQYDPSTHCFTIPVILPPASQTNFTSTAATKHSRSIQLVLPPTSQTNFTLDGFTSADGMAADPVKICATVGTNYCSKEELAHVAAAAKDPRLEHLLSAMKAARARLTSGVETIQWISPNLESLAKDYFKGIPVRSLTFKWQGTNQAYADISDIMAWHGIKSTNSFLLGTDGKLCWRYSDDTQDGPMLGVDKSSFGHTPDLQMTMADPFGLTHLTVAEAIATNRLVYLGWTQLDGRECYHVESWLAEHSLNSPDGVHPIRREWWIDARTLLPIQTTELDSFRFDEYRFHYTKLNQPLPAAVFQVPPGANVGAKPVLFRKYWRGPKQRPFLRTSDGSDGAIRGKEGWHGPKGELGSGVG